MIRNFKYSPCRGHHFAFCVARHVVCALSLCALSLCALLVGCGPSQREQQQQEVAEALRKLGHSEETIAAELKKTAESAKNNPGPTKKAAEGTQNTLGPTQNAAALSRSSRAAMRFEPGWRASTIIPGRERMPPQQLADAILNGENPTPQDVIDFLQTCSVSPPGRDLLMKIAARAVEICPPNDFSLVFIANGLLEYGQENPNQGDSAMDATVGLIEAVADAEENRYDAVSGDAVYVGIAESLMHSRAANITGNVRLNSRGQPDMRNYYFSDRQNRSDLLLVHLDYERLVRGVQARLNADPDVGISVMAVELGYRTRDKGLARLGLRFFERNPEAINQPDKPRDLSAHLEWARLP